MPTSRGLAGRTTVVRSGHFAQHLRFGQTLELLQRLVLDLPDPLARDVEGTPDLVERSRMLTAEPVAKLEHPPLPIGEILERLAEGLLRQVVDRAVVGRLGALVGDELAE